MSISVHLSCQALFMLLQQHQSVEFHSLHLKYSAAGDGMALGEHKAGGAHPGQPAAAGTAAPGAAGCPAQAAAGCRRECTSLASPRADAEACIPIKSRPAMSCALLNKTGDAAISSAGFCSPAWPLCQARSAVFLRKLCVVICNREGLGHAEEQKVCKAL